MSEVMGSRVDGTGTDRVVLLGNKRILGSGTMHELSQSEAPEISRFFSGPRARAAGRAHEPEVTL